MTFHDPEKQVDAQFPRKLSLLFKPSRYKVFCTVDAGPKILGVARALLILAAQKPMRVLCTARCKTPSWNPSTSCCLTK